MVYKNLFNRIFFSIFLFAVYIIALNDKLLLFFFGTIIYLFVFYEILKFFKNYFKLILFYLFTSYISFVLYLYFSYDFFIFNIFVFTIIFFDSFSYFSGKLYGKNFILKFISPKKTLEGYLGGFFFTNISYIIFFYFIDIEINLNKIFILINIIILFSIFGDLIESFFKRKNDIKDSSKYIPGHGGYFDRFDSFIASIIMLSIFSLL